MSDVLHKICDDKRDHVAAAKLACPQGEIEILAVMAPTPRGFADRLVLAAASGGYGLIAEIKKASPSKGVIREDFDPPALAQAYSQGGASCLSVLTDEPYFQGHDDYLVAASAAVDLPVLRKDFMLDPYQIYESRALGADCILLILAALEDGQAVELEDLAIELGMDVLIEVHNEAEMERACALSSWLIGINNRNLQSLEVDISTTETLAPIAPEDTLLISESGLYEPADLARMAAAGARCFLIGESLMRSPDVAAATKALLADPAPVVFAG